ncbi:choline kinase, cytoplasm [Mycena floridula]|nr:choline kinase, cytoplasm [Mycena floridula]
MSIPPSPFLCSTSPTPSSESIMRKLSSSSLQSLLVGTPGSVSSIQFGSDDEVEVIREEGLRHAKNRLEARRYKTGPFAEDLLNVIKSIRISTWTNSQISPKDLKVVKVAGSLTNAVFFVWCPAIPQAHKLLLRIYGPSSGSLISRPRELHTLHILSSQYGIGPRIYGTFENGRIEEYFDSTTLTASDLRDPQISRWIGARMADLHLVDIEAVEETSEETRGEDRGWEIGAKKNVRNWLIPAQEVLDLPKMSRDTLQELDLEAFREQWKKYMSWLKQVDDVNMGSRRVFAHNDTQYGNLLRATATIDVDDHRQIIVVDFEYASPNPASFDIANHFHEWTADYHSATPQILDHRRYPSFEQRRNFYTAYLEQVPSSTHQSLSPPEQEVFFKKFDDQIRFWSPASHAMWAIWGIVQAREDIENDVQEPEFDYIGYARCRMAGFRREIKALGL